MFFRERFAVPIGIYVAQLSQPGVGCRIQSCRSVTSRNALCKFSYRFQQFTSGTLETVHRYELHLTRNTRKGRESPVIAYVRSSRGSDRFIRPRLMRKDALGYDQDGVEGSISVGRDYVPRISFSRSVPGTTLVFSRRRVWSASQPIVTLSLEISSFSFDFMLISFSPPSVPWTSRIT